jgi:hypothetical protein
VIDARRAAKTFLDSAFAALLRKRTREGVAVGPSIMVVIDRIAVESIFEALITRWALAVLARSALVCGSFNRGTPIVFPFRSSG